jgi:hypothetical protein
VTWRRGLLVIAALIAVASIAFALKPFNGPNAISADPPDVAPAVQSAGISSFSVEMVVMDRTTSCGPALVDAWHSKPFRWRVHANDPGSTADYTATSTGSTCRKAAQHRVERAGIGLLAAALVLLVGLLLRHRPSSDPPPTESD